MVRNDLRMSYNPLPTDNFMKYIFILMSYKFGYMKMKYFSVHFIGNHKFQERKMVLFVSSEGHSGDSSTVITPFYTSIT